MPRITIELSDALYAELKTAAKSCEGGPNYRAENWASDLVASELAARRLPNVEQGRNGGRAVATAMKTYALALPDFNLERTA